MTAVDWPEIARWVAQNLWMSIALSALVGVVFGALVYHLGSRPKRYRLDSEIASLEAQICSEEQLRDERALALEQAEQRLTNAFSQLANQSLEQNSDHFLRLARENLGKHQERAKAELGERERAVADLVKPIQTALNKTQEQIAAIEKQRHESFGSITAQLELMSQNQQALQSETRNLVTALRRPEVRGQWGELTLRRIVELAGMVEHCDFIEQAHTSTDDGAMRPDMIVRLPERGEIIVDVKTPLDAYLMAAEASDETDRAAALKRHTRNVNERVRELSRKAYWNQFDRSPEFVVLFIPGEQFLTAALTENPTLLEDAMREKVIIATPTSLVALLRAVAYGWRQLTLAENAEQIRELAQEMHSRLATFTDHLIRVGKQLDGSVKAYNNAIGSLERSVLPNVRKFTELGLPEKKPIGRAEAIETLTRLPQNGDADSTVAPDDASAGDSDESNEAAPARPTDPTQTH